MVDQWNIANIVDILMVIINSQRIIIPAIIYGTFTLCGLSLLYAVSYGILIINQINKPFSSSLCMGRLRLSTFNHCP